MKCAGVNVAGQWRGSPCENEAQYQAFDGVDYCYAHYAIAEKEPERLDSALEHKGIMTRRRDKHEKLLGRSVSYSELMRLPD